MVPKTVKIEGVTYRSGFYGDLYPINFTYNDEYYKDGANKFRRVNCEKFDLIKLANDGMTYDLLYCADSQWEQAVWEDCSHSPATVYPTRRKTAQLSYFLSHLIS